MAHAFFLGVDHQSDENGSNSVTHTLLEKSSDDSDDAATFRLARIRNHDDVASADALAGHLQGLVAEQPYIGRTSLIVNRTGTFGQALVDALDERGLDPIAATLTDGTGSTAGGTDEMGVQLGGVDVLRVLADLYRDERLIFDSHSSEVASRLARDTQGLAERLDEADGDLEALGTSTVGPSFDPSAIHVTSAALAGWMATEWSFDPSQHLKEKPQTGSPNSGDLGA